MEHLTCRYRVDLEYDGTNYFGFQNQNHNNLKTIENSLILAIKNLSGEVVQIAVSGRTDAGVHALNQTINFDLNKNILPHQISSGLNHYLRLNNDTISVLKTTIVDDNFHARFSAKMRHYLYIITNRRAPLALDKFRSMHVISNLDLSAMIQASKFLIGQHDFSSFRDAECQSKSAIRAINDIVISSNNQQIFIEISAKSFLHHMVRNIVGTLYYVGIGKFRAEQMIEILHSCNRINSGPNAPACGLYFLRTDYN